MKNPYGVTDKLTADLFIDATRARDVSALMMKTEFVLGIQNKNTTIFFTKRQWINLLRSPNTQRKPSASAETPVAL